MSAKPLQRLSMEVPNPEPTTTQPTGWLALLHRTSAIWVCIVYLTISGVAPTGLLRHTTHIATQGRSSWSTNTCLWT